MKKGFKFILILLLIVGVLFGAKYVYQTYKEDIRIEELKKGWYVEITTESIKVRDDHDRYSYNKGNLSVKKGEVYKVLDVWIGDSSSFYWYKIEFKDGTNGWIANTYDGQYLIDHNNPTDIATPILKYFENQYIVNSIDDINYDHLECWDDRPGYELSHIVYHEVDESLNIDQYWIKYTITDQSGKSSSKTQKILFTIRPKENQVEDFVNFVR